MSSEGIKEFLAEDGEPINRRSRVFTEGFEHPAARGQLAGAGLTSEHYKKAQVAIVHNGFDQNTCNMHLEEFADVVRFHINSYLSKIFGEEPTLKGWNFSVV